ncbi:N-acetylglucosamine-6-phosphate deacetylase [Sneathiella sp.]|uniref:N-acetylglucosamine-6-phosphate deacetylase n=1 Tax=Sneathiella sp. TaxID=1964365 RepID=UPI00356A9EE4
MSHALTNCRIWTGSGWRDRHAVLISDGRITDIVGADDIPVGTTREDLGGGILVPGFIDVQVNGGGGVLFNDCTSLEDLTTLAATHRRFGTTGLLPTVISDSWSVMVEKAELIRAAITAGTPGILGLHFEGPYLNVERKGVHDAQQIRAVDEAFIELVTAGDLGAVVVTLAPEMVPLALIKTLADAGVRVAAGHSNATYEQTRAALDAGLSGFTHLFNAMAPMLSRAPGLIGAALSDTESFCGIIADGHHVHPATLRAAIAARGPGHMMLVTDAMPTVGTHLTRFALNGEKITVANGRCETADGVLAGSCLDMAAAARYAISELEQTAEDAWSMASSVPASFLGLEDSFGQIEAGYAADLVLLDHNKQVTRSWIGGR